MGRLPLAAVSLAALVAAACGSGPPRVDDTAEDLPREAACEEDTRFDDGREHRDGVEYEVDPPAGGDHDQTWVEPDVYSSSVDIGKVVHAMEHGDVVIWHRDPLSPRDDRALRGLAEEFPNHVLVVPRPSMEVPIAITAWHVRALCQGLDEDLLAEFVKEHRNKGPEGIVD